MSSLIDKLIQESEASLGLSKLANDENGAPDNPSNSAGGKQDVVSMVNAFIQKVEQLKAQLGQNVAGMQDGDPNAAVDPNAQGAVDENGNPVAQPAETAGSATIQTPGGSVIKIASLVKLAALRGSEIFKEAK